MPRKRYSYSVIFFNMVAHSLQCSIVVSPTCRIYLFIYLFKIDDRRTHLPSATRRPHLWCIGDTALAAHPRTLAVQNRGANFQSASWQRAMISGTSCRRRWPTWSASSAVSKYQPPSFAAHQAVCCWQPCFSGCRSSSLERSATGRRLIVIIADFLPSVKNYLISLSYPLLIFWSFDWHRYSGPCRNVRYLGHSKNLCLLTYYSNWARFIKELQYRFFTPTMIIQEQLL